MSSFSIDYGGECGHQPLGATQREFAHDGSENPRSQRLAAFVLYGRSSCGSYVEPRLPKSTVWQLAASILNAASVTGTNRSSACSPDPASLP